MPIYEIWVWDGLILEDNSHIVLNIKKGTYIEFETMDQNFIESF